MALRQQVLERVGDFAALAVGLDVVLSPAIVDMAVGEQQLADLVAHELRCPRTTRALAPAAFVLSILQFPIV
jgi:hypothetical protein